MSLHENEKEKRMSANEFFCLSDDDESDDNGEQLLSGTKTKNIDLQESDDEIAAAGSSKTIEQHTQSTKKKQIVVDIDLTLSSSDRESDDEGKENQKQDCLLSAYNNYCVPDSDEESEKHDSARHRDNEEYDPSRQYECKQCRKWFKTACSLKVHQRKHKGLKPYVCVFCKITKTTYGQIIRHIAKQHGYDRTDAKHHYQYKPKNKK
mmetsp:Transcript_31448/g.50939  ORF Transcript_31448/g.50939 Transcript_31448/m.50939 type:complete len:207 (-) Transcript_31448:84-704(-)